MKESDSISTVIVLPQAPTVAKKEDTNASWPVDPALKVWMIWGKEIMIVMTTPMLEISYQTTSGTKLSISSQVPYPIVKTTTPIFS